MEINRSNLTALFQGYQLLFQQAFMDTPTLMDKLAMTVPSKTSQEVYPWLGQTTRFREWVGDRVIQNLTTHDFVIKNKSYEDSVGVDRDAIEDDTYGVYSPIVQQLGQDARQHPDLLVFSTLAAGFTNPCYDGQYFFDTDHPVGLIGNQHSVSNFQGGSGTPWFLIDNTRYIKPVIFQKRRDYQLVAMDRLDDEGVFSRKEFRYGVDARCNTGYGLWQLAFGSKEDLDTDSYADIRAQMMAQKNDNGLPLNIRPSILVVPPSLEKAALEVLKAERLANGASNVYLNTADVLVAPWLA